MQKPVGLLCIRRARVLLRLGALADGVTRCACDNKVRTTRGKENLYVERMRKKKKKKQALSLTAPRTAATLFDWHNEVILIAETIRKLPSNEWAKIR